MFHPTVLKYMMLLAMPHGSKLLNISLKWYFKLVFEVFIFKILLERQNDTELFLPLADLFVEFPQHLGLGEKSVPSPPW